MWVNERDVNNTPVRTGWAKGGTMPDGADPWGGSDKPGLAWFDFSVLSNELGASYVFACPSDKNKRRAWNWKANDPKAGFLHPKFRDNAVSYFTDILAIIWPAN
jgi:hypothetical protein